MAKKLTTKEYHKQLYKLPKNIICISEYRGDGTKIMHQCPKGHQWLVSPSAIKQGVGCSTCSKRKKLSTKEYQEELSKITTEISCIGEYLGTMTKTLHKCSAGHTWLATPNSIKNNSGCPKCTPNHKVTPEEYSAYLLDSKRGIFANEAYQTATTPISHGCSLGHQWTTTPSSIKCGSGCPTCANLRTKREIYKNKPTWLYYIYILSLGIYKIGVTKEPNPGCLERYKKSIIENDYRVISEVQYQDGYEAYQLEQHLLTKNRKKRWTPNQRFDGYTECFSECIQPDLVNIQQIPILLL